ncbi:MAG TPA: hypothetical protein VE573_15790 [Nitrososphaeraceae archaeon]|nr:hypothetical protein [Nitrososphaeraceae archaeon]
MTSKEKNLFKNAASVIVHFLTKQNLRDTRTAYRGENKRPEHNSINITAGLPVPQ